METQNNSSIPCIDLLAHMDAAIDDGSVRKLYFLKHKDSGRWFSNSGLSDFKKARPFTQQDHITKSLQAKNKRRDEYTMVELLLQEDILTFQ